MVTFLMEMFDELSQSEIEQFKQWLSQYFHCMNKLPGVRNVLHFACFEYPLLIDTLRLFLEAGANPNATDKTATVLLTLWHKKCITNILSMLWNLYLLLLRCWSISELLSTK